jgi:hypothetical protein
MDHPESLAEKGAGLHLPHLQTSPLPSNDLRQAQTK